MPDGKPQLPLIIFQIPIGSGGFIRFYTSPWKRMAFRKSPAAEIAIVIELWLAYEQVRVISQWNHQWRWQEAVRGFRFLLTFGRGRCKSGERSHFVGRSERRGLVTCTKSKMIIIQTRFSNNLIMEINYTDNEKCNRKEIPFLARHRSYFEAKLIN